MNENGFVILQEYPKNGNFKEKEYLLLENGVYLHVIDSGNGIRPVQDNEILSIAKGQFLGGVEGNVHFDGFLLDDKWAKWPLMFKYSESPQFYDDDNFLCDGYTSIMKYVGNESCVSMIIPFTCGSVYQQATYLPIYYEKVIFTITE